MTTPWTVRPAADRDAERIASINVLSWRHAYDGIVPRPVLDALDPARRVDGWRRRIALPAPDAMFVAVGADDVPVAYASAGADRQDGATGAGELMAIYADPAHLGTGAGHLVHEAAVRHLAAQGFHSAVLWVLTANEPSRRFYAAHGWRDDGVHTELELGGVPLTEVRYSRAL